MKIRHMKYNFARQLIIYLIMLFAISAIICDAIPYRNEIELIICGSFILILFIFLAEQYLSYIYIDEKGVLFKSPLRSYLLKWEEIKHINIVNRWMTTNGRTYFPWILIATIPEKKDMTKKRYAFNRKGISITCVNIKGMVHEIWKYWDIDNSCKKAV